MLGGTQNNGSCSDTCCRLQGGKTFPCPAPLPQRLLAGCPTLQRNKRHAIERFYTRQNELIDGAWLALVSALPCPPWGVAPCLCS